jgi:hypothetical protein
MVSKKIINAMMVSHKCDDCEWNRAQYEKPNGDFYCSILDKSWRHVWPDNCTKYNKRT